MSRQRAIAKARALARKTGDVWFVVFEGPEGYAVLCEEDMECWGFHAYSRHNVIYCTED